MKQSLLFFIAAALFLIAGLLDLFDAGPNLKTAISVAMVSVMIALGLRSRRAAQ